MLLNIISAHKLLSYTFNHFAFAYASCSKNTMTTQSYLVNAWPESQKPWVGFKLMTSQVRGTLVPLLSQQDASGRCTFFHDNTVERFRREREPESVPAGSTSLPMLSCYDWLGLCMGDDLTYKGSDLLQLKWIVQVKYSLWWHAAF